MLIATGFAIVTLGGGVGADAHATDGKETGQPAAVAQHETARGDGLIQPQHVTIDAGLSPQRARLVLLRVRELYTFWDTGDVAYLYRADSPSFIDHTLPQGRQQGLRGIEQASRQFRAAVPDLHCSVADVLVSGDRVSVRQVYTGHFTGTYDGVRGHGQPVRFNAFDIQQVGRSQIVADWHLEDNLTFLTQIGAR